MKEDVGAIQKRGELLRRAGGEIALDALDRSVDALPRSRLAVVDCTNEPRSTRCEARWEPMKPSAPVMTVTGCSVLATAMPSPRVSWCGTLFVYCGGAPGRSPLWADWPVRRSS